MWQHMFWAHQLTRQKSSSHWFVCGQSFSEAAHRRLSGSPWCSVDYWRRGILDRHSLHTIHHVEDIGVFMDWPCSKHSQRAFTNSMPMALNCMSRNQTLSRKKTKSRRSLSLPQNHLPLFWPCYSGRIHLGHQTLLGAFWLCLSSMAWNNISTELRSIGSQASVQADLIAMKPSIKESGLRQ